MPIKNILITVLLASLSIGCMARYPHTPQVIGTVTYYDRIALPPNAALDVSIVDAAEPDPEKAVLCQQHITRRLRRPAPFSMWFDRSKVNPAHTYLLSARIKVGKETWFDLPQPVPVITQGNPQVLDLLLVFLQSPEQRRQRQLAPTASKL